MRSFWGNSSESTMSGTRFSVSKLRPSCKKLSLMVYYLAVASKCGFVVFSEPRTVSNAPSHIKEYIDGTIERLGFTPDLYYLHRIDPSMWCRLIQMPSAYVAD